MSAKQRFFENGKLFPKRLFFNFLKIFFQPRKVEKTPFKNYITCMKPLFAAKRGDSNWPEINWRRSALILFEFLRNIYFFIFHSEVNIVKVTTVIL